MADNGPQIMAYCYSEGPVNGAGPELDANSTMATIEQVTSGTTSYARPLVPELFSTQLETIRVEWDDSAPHGLYSLSYDDDTERVTVQSENFKAFRPQMTGNSALWFGFSQDLSASAGWATTWVASAAPAGLVELFAAEVAPAEDAARIDLARYRHGRAVATVWGNRQAHRVRLHFRSGAKAQIEAGFVTSGRVRIWQCGDAAAYSPTNVGGYIDGWVLASDNATEDGDIGGIWSVDMVVGVAR